MKKHTGRQWQCLKVQTRFLIEKLNRNDSSFLLIVWEAVGLQQKRQKKNEKDQRTFFPAQDIKLWDLLLKDIVDAILTHVEWMQGKCTMAMMWQGADKPMDGCSPPSVSWISFHLTCSWTFSLNIWKEQMLERGLRAVGTLVLSWLQLICSCV